MRFRDHIFNAFTVTLVVVMLGAGVGYACYHAEARSLEERRRQWSSFRHQGNSVAAAPNPSDVYRRWLFHREALRAMNYAERILERMQTYVGQIDVTEIDDHEARQLESAEQQLQVALGQVYAAQGLLKALRTKLR